jgi:hypothetical protein
MDEHSVFDWIHAKMSQRAEQLILAQKQTNIQLCMSTFP